MNIAPSPEQRAPDRTDIRVDACSSARRRDAQAHQRAARIRRPCPKAPLHVGSSDSTVVTCVKAKTNTRSNKSSSECDPVLGVPRGMLAHNETLTRPMAVCFTSCLR